MKKSERVRAYVEALAEDIICQKNALSTDNTEDMLAKQQMIGILDGISNMINVTFDLEPTEYEQDED